MSAFPNTGRSDHSKLEKLSGCFRPEADVGVAGMMRPIYALGVLELEWGSDEYA